MLKYQVYAMDLTHPSILVSQNLPVGDPSFSWAHVRLCHPWYTLLGVIFLYTDIFQYFSCEILPNCSLVSLLLSIDYMLRARHVAADKKHKPFLQRVPGLVESTQNNCGATNKLPGWWRRRRLTLYRVLLPSNRPWPEHIAFIISPEPPPHTLRMALVTPCGR